MAVENRENPEQAEGLQAGSEEQTTTAESRIGSEGDDSTEAPGTPHATASGGGTAWNLAAAVAAWAWPGLGHLLTGERSRGLILMAAIGGLYLTGLLVSGVSAVDRDGQRLAFAGQAMIAPTLAIDRWASGRIRETPGELDGWDVEPAIGRPREIGVLYTALAGMLNTLVILDVAHRGQRGPRPQPAERRGDDA